MQWQGLCLTVLLGELRPVAHLLGQHQASTRGRTRLELDSSRSLPALSDTQTRNPLVKTIAALDTALAEVEKG
eukprot:8525511-Alexandrium_andersonii.AAC.1